MNISVVALILTVSAISAAHAQKPQTSVPCMHASDAESSTQGCLGMMGRDPREVDGEDVSGWSMMTPKERRLHREHMASFNDKAACRGYMEEHHQAMVQRAKERGLAIPSRPLRDPCARLDSSPAKRPSK